MHKPEKKPIRPDIIAAAAKVFGARGYQQATLDEIAAHLGIKKGSLYYHIDSKEQLLFAVYTQLFAALETATARAVKASDAPLVQLENIITAIINVIYDNRDTAGVFLHEYRALDETHLRHRLKDRGTMMTRLEDVLKSVYKVEGIDPQRYPVRVATLGILGMCNWVSDWIALANYSRDEVAATFVKMVIQGVRQRELIAKNSVVAPVRKAGKTERRKAG